MKIKASELKDGDVVEIGECRMIIRRKYSRDGNTHFNAYAGRTDPGLGMTYRDDDDIELVFRYRSAQDGTDEQERQRIQQVADMLAQVWRTRTTPEGQRETYDPNAGLWLGDDELVRNWEAREKSRSVFRSGADTYSDGVGTARRMNEEGL